MLVLAARAARSSRVEAHRDRAGMRVEPFGFAERDRGRAERAQLLGPAFEDRGALHEIEHAEPGREARRARGRQHVVRAADIVADRLRRMRAEEDRAGIADAAGEASASAASISRCSGAIASTSGTASSSVPTRMMAPKSRQDAPAMSARGSVLSCASTAFSTASASAASSVIRIDCALASCSACARRSAAIQSGLPVLSARISTSDGPAIMSMPTLPNTSRFAAAT